MSQDNDALRRSLQTSIAELSHELARAEALDNSSVFLILAGDTPLQFVMRDHKPVTAAPCEVQLATRFTLADAEMIAAALPARPDRPIRVADARSALRTALAGQRARLFALEHGVNVISWQGLKRQ
ncbi:hypothetical protein [Chitinilyticum litopenaei]|uniref:hypothetical protein n=1 Tax=Chitinilyticum litopenaei TaxID=1121276 RepID=UPI0004147194|nr:hypothetical protein [Chitinilyticum litopenaei]